MPELPGRTSAPTLTPSRDGVDHVNAYSKGQTKLGRLLSNFAPTPVDLGPDGVFQSIEGYWYWLGTRDVKAREELRCLTGYAAKALGRKLRHPRQLVFGFEAKIKHALTCKVKQNPELRELLRESTLPIVHYYVTGRGDVVVPGRHLWVWEHYEHLRTKLQSP